MVDLCSLRSSLIDLGWSKVESFFLAFSITGLSPKSCLKTGAPFSKIRELVKLES